MSVSSTEGKTFIGIVVAGDDAMPDPYGMGRVKVLCPSIHHPDIKAKDLPWCFMASQPDNIGAFSFNRPPPVGSIVEVFYSPGTKSTAQGMIRSVINGVHNPHGIMAHKPGKDLSNKGYYSLARMTIPLAHSGPAITTMNESDPLQAQISYRPYPYMLVRDGMDSSLANKAHVRLFYKLKSVSAAKQWCACIFDYEGTKSETPPATYTAHDIGLDEWIGYVTSRMCDEFLKMGARNFAAFNMNPVTTSESTLNFAYSGKKTYDISWRLSTLNMFTTMVHDQVSLNYALHTAQSYAWYQANIKCVQGVAIPSPCMEPQWEFQIQKDVQECKPNEPKPGGDCVDNKVLDKCIQRTIECDGKLSVQGEEKDAEKLTEKLKKVPYAGGTGWFTSVNIGTVILRINKSDQESGPILKSRNSYPQRLINNTYKVYKGGALIDKGDCKPDEGTD